MFKHFSVLALFLVLSSVSFGQVNIEELDQSAVTIKSNTGQGSGSIILKEMVVDNDGNKETVAFCLTAAHVIDGHRTVRTIIEDGKEVKAVEFSDPSVVREIQYEGRSVGEMQMKAKVVRYSESEKGHDLALMMLYDSSMFKSEVKFEQDKNYIPQKGTEVLLMSSPGGFTFANTLTSGIISQTGRLLNVGKGSGYVFDSSTASSSPGSSGGGLVRKEDGLYIGMLVRGSGENFTYVIPIRRIYDWAKDANIEFIFDENIEAPTLKELLEVEVE